MGFVGRMNFFAKLVLSVAVIGLIWFRIVNPYLIPKLEDGGKYHGPMSSPIMNMESVVYGVIGLLLIGGFVWLIASNVRSERSQSRRRGPPPK
jgi:hypothetical protein